MNEEQQKSVPFWRRTGTPAAGTGIAIGAGVGTAIGVATGNVELWLPLGLVVGLVTGMSIGRRRDDAPSEKT